jgi:hypothetical protein
MNLENRLRKLESIHLFESKIIFVRFGDDVKVLSCAGEKFYRNEDETEDDFISRIMGIIELRPNRPDVTVLTSSF